MAMGTPYYMAPEQVSGRPATPLVDVYAYGLLVYELFTGTRAVTGETMEQVFFQILHQPLDVQAMANVGAPAALCDLVGRCTAKNAEDRPQGFPPILETLRGLLSADADSKTQVVPQTPPAAAPVPKSSPDSPAPTPRKPGLAIPLAAAFLVVLIAAAGVYWWSSSRPAAVVPGMVYIPAGTFLAGPNNQQVKLPAFYIDEAEVSNSELADFCRETGCTTPAGPPDNPAVNVTITVARAYAKWRGKRLPTILEWERAAHGANNTLFPWGEDRDPRHANVKDNPLFPDDELVPVRSFNPYPAYNMIGNAFEMVEGAVTPTPTTLAQFSFLNPAPNGEERWVAIRGGSYNVPLSEGLVYDYGMIPERYSSADIGFRCAKDP
jgi:hypothetical protein